MESPRHPVARPTARSSSPGSPHVATQAMDFAVARYNPDGSLDQSFDGDGKVTADFGGFDQALGVVTLPDERIVVVGVINHDDFALARYNPDGSLDQSFDGDGK
jgi:uncharacterized delta-60 repeat protein